MKRALALLLTCALGLSLLSGCSQASAAKELTADPIKLTDADMMAHDLDALNVYAALAGFGLELLQAARTDTVEDIAERGSTGTPFVFVSPLSVALALSMAANGADGDTLAQFEETLGNGVSVDAVNVACRALMTIYQNLLAGSTKCTLANSLWVDPDGQIRDDFVGTCRGVFDAQVFQGELSAPGIVNDLNGWVSEHTNKMIPRIINKPFPENTALLLVNALHLKNRWLQEFDPFSTREMDFHYGNGGVDQVKYLQHFDTELSYIQGEGAQGVVLPYDDGRLAFFALLPDLYPDSPDFGQWLNTLEGDDLTQLLNSREDARFLRFAMPKFRAESIRDLEDILPELGLVDAFVPGVANFSEMGDNPEGYYISQVVHAARIEVNEKGTEAAAATVVPGPTGPAELPQEGITLVLDRPFLYGIIDLQNGVPLFLGTYE